MPFINRPTLGCLVDAASGIVHKYIHVPEFFKSGPDEMFTGTEVRDIGGYHQGASSDLSDARRHILEQRNAARRENDVGSVLGEQQSRGAAYSGPTARHDRHPTIKREHPVRHSAPPDFRCHSTLRPADTAGFHAS